MAALNVTERDFPIHTAETAPDASKAPIAWYAENFGIVPNLAGILADEDTTSAHEEWAAWTRKTAALVSLGDRELAVEQVRRFP